MRRFFLVLFIITIPLVSYGQYKSESGPVDIAKTLKYPMSVGKRTMGILGLDPNRLSISQSYTMSYLSGGGGEGTTQGLYLNTMTYDFSAPLTLTFQWGMMHQPFAANEQSPVFNNGPFVSGASLRYEPLKNTVLEISYKRYPYGYNPYYYSNRNRFW